jgi:hypothetical protein
MHLLRNRHICGWVFSLSAVGGVAVALLVVFPLGYVSYDTTYGLVWGREIAHGSKPDYGAFLASTPHPLVELFGILVSPLGQLSALGTVVVLSYLALGALACLVAILGSLWFDRLIGVVAAAIIMVSQIVLGTGLRGALDIPYVLLCLGAVIVETRRRRAGWPVLGLLAVAGLLRPEAWLFSVAYLAYLAFDVEGGRLGWRRERSGGALLSLAGLAVLGPVVWCLFDQLTTGDALHSLTSTQESARVLGRQRGPLEWLRHGPHRIGQVIEWPAALAAIVGLGLGLAFLRRRSLLGVVAVVLAVVAFAIVGFGGLPILPRYAILSGTLLAVFAALGLLGWRLLPHGHGWRRRWQAVAVLLALFFVVWAPRQWVLDTEMAEALSSTGRIERGLSDVFRGVHVAAACGAVAVPGYPAIPRVALATGMQPSRLLEGRVPARGYLVVPRDQAVAKAFLSEAEGRMRRSTAAPPGFSLVAADSTWRLYRRC